MWPQAFCAPPPLRRVAPGGRRATCQCTATGLVTHVLREGAARTVLLVHDFMTDGRLFARLKDEGVLGDTRLLAVDLRAHGRTPPPTAPYSHVADILEAANGERVHLVGAGNGGIHALEAAIEAGSAAVASVTCISSGLPGHPWPRDAYFDITRARGSSDAHQWIDAYMNASSVWKRTMSRVDSSVLLALREMTDEYSAFHFLHRDPQLIPDRLPLSMRLADVQVPVLASVGELDELDFHQIAAQIAQGVSNHHGDRPFVIPRAGHFATLENAPAVAKMLADFWDSIDILEADSRQSLLSSPN